MIEAVIFDKDGTLFEFGTTWEAWAQSFLMRLADNDARIAQRLGRAIDFDLATRRFGPQSVVIAGTPEDIAQALMAALPGWQVEDLVALMNEEALEVPQREATALAPLLRGLAGRGLRLGVATNDAEGPARAHLAQAGVLELFDFIAGSDSGFGGKPAPGQLLAFARQVGVAPGSMLMVGDSLHDLRAGRAAGAQTLGVLTGLASHAQLAPLADAVLPDIGHLPGWLDQRAAGEGAR